MPMNKSWYDTLIECPRNHNFVSAAYGSSSISAYLIQLSLSLNGRCSTISIGSVYDQEKTYVS
jgi:hypothetical protein